MTFKTIANQNDQAEIVERIKNLQYLRKPRFSTMSSSQILPHLTDPMRVALGEKSAKKGSVMYWIFSWSIIRWAAIWFLPWPPVPAQPEFIPGKGGTLPNGFNQDKQVLIDYIKRMADLGPSAKLRDHPVFGDISIAQWQRLMWRHIDYHLKRFED